MRKRDLRNLKVEPPPKTGWPPGLLQDDCRELSKWFASRPDALYVLRKNLANYKV